MREQLIQYVNLLFAGATDSDETKQEILQNTLDRFDDLVAQGKSPEAAYRLAISGIGDINEILGNVSPSPVSPVNVDSRPVQQETEEDIKRKKIRGFAVAMYILCPIPVILFGCANTDFMNVLGLCLTLILVAFATYLMIITGRKDEDDEDDDDDENEDSKAKHPLKESIGNLIWVIGLIAYFVLSFTSGAWYITWLIFPIIACARGLSDAIIDLKEAKKNEI